MLEMLNSHLVTCWAQAGHVLSFWSFFVNLSLSMQCLIAVYVQCCRHGKLDVDLIASCIITHAYQPCLLHADRVTCVHVRMACALASSLRCFLCRFLPLSRCLFWQPASDRLRSCHLSCSTSSSLTPVLPHQHSAIPVSIPMIIC